MMTAMEWLEDQMKTWGYLSAQMRVDIVQKAKEMEKEQIVEAFKHSKLPTLFADNLTAEQYYEETFRTGKQ
jgi:hypothetical protein